MSRYVVFACLVKFFNLGAPGKYFLHTSSVYHVICRIWHHSNHWIFNSQNRKWRMYRIENKTCNLEPRVFSLFDMWKDGKKSPGIIILILLPDWSYTFVTLRNNYVIFAFVKEIRFYIGSFENIMETFPLRCICIVSL